MRLIKYSISIIIFLWAVFFNIFPQAISWAYTWVDVKEIRIVDISGNTEVISNPKITDDDNDSFGSDHFKIVTNKTPLKISWVHYSQIKKVVVTDTDQVEIYLDNNTSLKGVLNAKSLNIEGTGSLGKISLPFQKVRTLEFLMFSDSTYEGSNKKVVENFGRIEYAKKWKSTRSIKPKYEIIDADQKYIANSIMILNSYQTNMRGFTIYGDEFFRSTDLINKWLKVKKGELDYDVDLDNIDELTFTGDTGNGWAEVFIKNIDGSQGDGKVKFLKRIKHYAPSGKFFFSMSETSKSEEFGIGQDDMLIWETEYGYEGRSIFTNHAIHYKRLK
jgi:hypothetical protein